MHTITEKWRRDRQLAAIKQEYSILARNRISRGLSKERLELNYSGIPTYCMSESSITVITQERSIEC